MQTEEINNNDKLQDEIKEAVEAGLDIRDTVRSITLEALSDGSLNIQSIRKVSEAVLKGAGLGVSEHGSQAGEVLQQASQGLDQALSGAAEASKLALQEAVGRGEEFSSQNLKQGLEDLQSLEKLYLTTLKDVAKESKDQIADILNDLAQHADRTGTAVGKQLEEGLSELVEQITNAGKTQLETGTDSIKATGSMLAQIASGILGGIADSLDPSSRSKKGTDKKSSDNST